MKSFEALASHVTALFVRQQCQGGNTEEWPFGTMSSTQSHKVKRSTLHSYDTS